MAGLVAEQQVKCLKATEAELTLIRQGQFLRLSLNPFVLWVPSHMPFIGLSKTKTLTALRASEPSPFLPMDSLMVPQFSPTFKGLSTTTTGVALTLCMSEHVRSQSSHMSK